MCPSCLSDRNGAESAQARDEPASAERRTALRVLIVEDHDDSRVLLRELVMLHGAVAIEAATYAEALTLRVARCDGYFTNRHGQAALR